MAAEHERTKKAEMIEPTPSSQSRETPSRYPQPALLVPGGSPGIEAKGKRNNGQQQCGGERYAEHSKSPHGAAVVQLCMYVFKSSKHTPLEKRARATGKCGHPNHFWDKVGTNTKRSYRRRVILMEVGRQHEHHFFELPGHSAGVQGF